jgi:hypothetical protein
MRARQVKRTALVIKPQQPYIQWANSLDDEGVKRGEDVEPEHRVYLVYDISSFEIDVEATVAPYFEFIFEEELNAWHRLESDWPARRDFATFLAWFEVEYHSMVIDLGRGRVRARPYWRY